tara:strand:+ start:27674 stop:28960 length:1287 start_codon:yes stop_codon:yes gene_type:complete
MDSPNKGLLDISSFSLGVSTSILFGFFLSVLVSYKLTQEEAGLFFLLNSYFNILLVLSMFGLQQFWIKSLSYPVRNKSHLYSDYLIILILTIFWTILFLFYFFYIQGFKNFESILPIVLFMSFIFGSIFFETFLIKLQIQLNFKLYGLLVTIPNLVRLCLAFIFLYLSETFLSFSYSQFFSSLILVIFGMILIRDNDWLGSSNHFNKISFIEFKNYMQNFVSKNYNFLIVNLIFVFHTQTPIIYSSFVFNPEQVAFLGVAYVIFLGFFFFPNLIIQRYMFPIMANLKKLDKFPNSIYLVRSFFILFVGLLISGIGYVFSDFIFSTVFSELYRTSIGIFNIIIYSLPLKLLVAYLVNLCVVNDLTNTLNRFLILGLILNFAVFFVFSHFLSFNMVFLSLILFELIFVTVIFLILYKNRSVLFVSDSKDN